MGKKIAPISALTVAKLTKIRGYHAVGGADGLYLRVAGESRTWVFRYMMQGKRRDMSLGPIAETSLERARDLAIDQRRQVRQGIDPLATRQADRAGRLAAVLKQASFDECAAAYIEAHAPGWKSPKHRKQWVSTIALHASPIIGKLPVSSIDTGMLLKCLEPIWKTTTETASRLRGRIESVLDWATVRGYRQGDNPARWKGHLDHLLPAPGKVTKREHLAALPYREIQPFMAQLIKQEGMGALALQFAILTAARSGEVRAARWSEIDLATATWTIPAERMKAGREHYVPLSDRSMALLEALPRFADSDLLFPSPRLLAMSDMTLTRLLHRMGRSDITAHGFRSTFRDWAGETTAHAREVIEHALAHRIPDRVEAAYARGTLFDKRRKLMQGWAECCFNPPATAEVTPIRRGEAAA